MQDPSSTSPALRPWVAYAGGIGAAVCWLFLSLVVALQFARSDLGWVHSQLSLYLHGPYGLLLRTGYCVLAMAMALLAFALHCRLRPEARSGTVLGLFWVAALSLSTVAIGDSWLPEQAPTLAPMVHLLSAQSAFLCVIAAVLLQSWYFRRDRAWRGLHRPAFGLAWLAFAILAWHVGVDSAPRGLSQKLAIVLIVAWLALIGRRLSQASVTGAAHEPGSRDNAGDNPT